jgi:hypothetical protein
VFNELVKSDDVGMMQFFEDLYLVLIFAFDPSWVLFLHLLYCHNLACFLVQSPHDRAETAVAEGFAQFVFLHYIFYRFWFIWIWVCILESI